MMSLTETLELIISANAQGAVSELNSFASTVDSKLGATESRLKSFSDKALKIGAAGIGVGGFLSALGSKEQEAAGQLEAAIGQVGQSYDEFRDRIEETVKSQEHFGHTSAETKDALTTLTTAYGDTGAALDRMQLVADLAARKHESLSEAATQVAKAHGGATRVFKEFGVQVGQNADGTKNLDGALDVLGQKLQGQAAASADTFTGRMKALGVQVEDIVANFGEKFGPAILGVSVAITALAPAVSGVSAAFGKLSASRAANAAAEADELALHAAVTDALLANAAAADGVVASEAEISAAIDAVIASRTAEVGVTEASTQALVLSQTEVAAAIEGASAAALGGGAAMEGLAVGEDTAAAGAVALDASLAGTLAVFAPIAALVAVGVGVFSAFTDALSSNVQAEGDYASALKNTTGELNDNVDAVTAAKIVNSGVKDSAEGAGISLRLMADAVRGGTDDWGTYGRVLDAASTSGMTGATQIHQLDAALRAAGAGGTQFGQALLGAIDSGKLTVQQALRIVLGMEGLHNGYTNAAKGAGEQKTAQDELAGSGVKILDVFGRVVATQKDADKVQDDYNKAVAAFPQFADNMATAMGKTFDATNAALKSTLGFHEALTGLTEDFKQNGLSVDENTKSGQANLENMLKVGESISGLIQQKFKETHSVQEATAAGDMYVENLKGQLLQAGYTQGQVEYLIATMHLTPKDISTTFNTNGPQEQLVVGEYLKTLGEIPPELSSQIRADINMGDLAAANQLLDSAAHARFVDFFPVTHSGSGNFMQQRWGGVIHSYAHGGLEPGVYQGTMVRAFEPETGGEAYVPRLGDRTRSLATLKEAAGWYGAQVVDGARPSGTVATGRGGGYNPTYNVVVNGTNMSADEIVNALRKYEQRNGAGWRSN